MSDEELDDVVRVTEAGRLGLDLLEAFGRGKPVDYRSLSVDEWDRASKAADMLDALDALEGAS